MDEAKGLGCAVLLAGSSVVFGIISYASLGILARGETLK